MTLYDSLRRGAEEYPNRPAIVFRDETITYGALARDVNRLASALRGRGFGKGDRIAVLLPNCPQFTTAYFAASALGAVCAPANPLLKPPEFTYMWNDSAVKVVVTAPHLLQGVLDARSGIPSLSTVVSTGIRAETPAGVPTLDELMAEGVDGPIQTEGVTQSDPAVCIYTSGTTGRPKGALLSHLNLTSNCRMISDVLDITESDNFLTVLPLFHAFAGTVCQNAVIDCGATSTYLDSFHPARVLDALLNHGVTIFPGVPAMYAAMLQLPAERTVDLSCLRLCVSGGAPMPIAVMQAFEQRFNTVIIEGDGPTECSPVTSVNPPKGVRKPGSIGLPMSGVEMRIFSDTDCDMPANEVGEIVVRGENVMLGYHNQPDATAEAMRNGWYHTGDLGKVDEDGYFFIVDRKKDMLIVGGLNVYPREVEEVLYTHPGIQDAAVLGTPSKLRGEDVTAIVVRKPGFVPTEREIVRYCRERLANYKVPRSVVFRDSLPIGGTGKVLKRMLRKELDLEG